MNTTTYTTGDTGLIIVDSYNDFLSAGGKLWPYSQQTAEGVGLLPHMRQVLAATRRARIRTVIAPHHRTAPLDYTTWRYLSPLQLAVAAAVSVPGAASSSVSTGRTSSPPGWPT